MFTEWFNQKYHEWRNDRWGQDSGVSAFARYLDVKQQLIDAYMRGTIPRDKKILNKLAEKLGSEVYQEIGLNLTPRQKSVIDINLLPPDAYPELHHVIKELRAKYSTRKPQN